MDRATICFRPSDRLALLQLIALMTNKWATSAEENEFLEASEYLVEGLSDKNLDNDRRNKLEIISWVWLYVAFIYE